MNMTDQEAVSERVRAFLAARESMGSNIDKSVIADIRVMSGRYQITTHDLRILSGWDGQPMEQPSLSDSTS
jgi:hypothetical protein